MPITRKMNLINVHFWTYLTLSCYLIPIRLFPIFPHRNAFHVWRKNPNITILGNEKARRLPIFSMLVHHPDSGKILHHNFVSVLLNDLYGIQARGGCACAGPYAQV